MASAQTPWSLPLSLVVLEVLSPSAVLPVMAVSILFVWAIHTSLEVVATTTEPLEVAVHTVELSELSACLDTTTKIINKLSSCIDMTMEVVPELSAFPP